MNLTYKLPKDFKEDEAVVSLADAAAYANFIEKETEEKWKNEADELSSVIKKFLENETRLQEFERILNDAYYNYLDFKTFYS